MIDSTWGWFPEGRGEEAGAGGEGWVGGARQTKEHGGGASEPGGAGLPHLADFQPAPMCFAPRWPRARALASLGPMLRTIAVPASGSTAAP
jgi:hypothetical protein